jgi:hypothetical protein
MITREFDLKGFMPSAHTVYDVGPVESPKKFSVSLVKEMMGVMEGLGFCLKHITISPEDMEELRNYYDDRDPGPYITHFWPEGQRSFWDITLMVDERLSGTGKVVGQVTHVGEPSDVIVIGNTGR